MVSIYGADKNHKKIAKKDSDRFYIIDSGVFAAVKELSALNAKYVVNADRQSNDLKTYNEIILTMVKRGVSKDAVVVGIGGGTVYALSGFVAATYMRGVKWVYAPTTFTGLADCSVGGRCGLKYENRECLIGRNYPPEYVYYDKKLLASQPESAKIGGICRIVRMSLLDKRLLNYTQKNIARLCGYDDVIIDEIMPLYRKALARRLSRGGQALRSGKVIGNALFESDNGKRNYGEYLIFGIMLETCVFKSEVKNKFYDIETRLFDELNLKPLDFNVENVVKLCFDDNNHSVRVPVIVNTGKTAMKIMTESAMLSLLNQFRI